VTLPGSVGVEPVVLAALAIAS